MLGVRNEHRELTEAGWSYRMNERGWVIYRDPRSGRWHTREEAVEVFKMSPADCPLSRVEGRY